MARPERERRTGTGPLHAAGSAAQWCRDVVRVTRPAGRVDAALDAVCAASPKRPHVASGALLGGTLAEVVDRPDPEQHKDDEPAHRRRRRVDAAARDLAGRDREDCPPGTRPRPRRAEVSETPPPPGRTPRPAGCPPDRLADVPPKRSLSGTGRLPVARLRALAASDLGETTPGAMPGRGDSRPRVRWPAPRPGSSTSLPTSAREHPDGGIGATVATRLARRIGAREPGDLAGLGRARVRATGPAADLTSDDLRLLAGAHHAANRTVQPGRDAARGTTGESRGARRPRRRGHDDPTVAAPRGTATNVAAPGRRREGAHEPMGLGPTPPPIQPDPPADVRAPRDLTRHAEPPAMPLRLDGGPLADHTEAARGLPWTGSAPATADVRAAMTSVGLSEPDLELVLTRILDDVARRHGIEV